MIAIAPIATRLNQAFPWLKRCVPRRVKRFILLRLVGVRRGYVPPPSRAWLETEVLPVLPRLGFRRILFVGAAPYTWHYERIVLSAGGKLITMDINPSASVWGASGHIQAPIQEVCSHCAAGSFDAVILNGVFGFGVNSVIEMNRSLEAVKGVIRTGGLLVLGWNKDLIADPTGLEQLRHGWEPATDMPIATRREFVEETHVYDFRIRSDPNCPDNP